jgi:hypothetical protein
MSHANQRPLSRAANAIAHTLVSAWNEGAITPYFEVSAGPLNTVRPSDASLSLMDRSTLDELVRAGLIYTTVKDAGRMEVTLMPGLSEYVARCAFSHRIQSIIRR